MASFARGFRLLSCPKTPLIPQTFLQDLSSAQSRFFTASMRLRASATPKLQPRLPKEIKSKSPTSQANNPPSSPSPSPLASIAPSRYAFVKSLSSKKTPTLLYEAPSHFWFYFGCWTSGLSIITWTVLTGPKAIQQPEGIPQWVGLTFGVSYTLLGAMGFYLISKTPNIVSSIRMLPPLQAAGQAATQPGISAGVPQLEVTVKRMVPLLQPRVIKADLDKVTLKTRFSLPSEYVPELRRLELQLEDEARKKALWKFDMEHLFTMPFRRISRAFVNMFKGVKAAWTDVGYGIIKVDGKQYKVDVTRGYAHDGFRTLEQIVNIGWK